MNWQIQQILRRRRAAETGAIPAGRGGTLAVCLVYPNHYSVAMSSLGFQAVYKLFNDQSYLVCERAFLPDREEFALYEKSGDTLVSFENERPLSDFDLIAFSVSFEPDFINIPRILRLARISELSAERGDAEPLVLAGGAAFFINPEPVADLIDLIAVGEGESLIPTLADFLVQQQHTDRQELLRQAAGLPGIYVPSLPSLQPGPLRAGRAAGRGCAGECSRAATPRGRRSPGRVRIRCRSSRAPLGRPPPASPRPPVSTSSDFFTTMKSN